MNDKWHQLIELAWKQDPVTTEYLCTGLIRSMPTEYKIQVAADESTEFFYLPAKYETVINKDKQALEQLLSRLRGA